MEEPLRQIAANAGFEGSVVVEKVREGKDGFGFNAATGEYEDLLAAGIIDPKQVSRFALQHASSVAALLLTTECAIAELPSLSLRLLLRPAWAAAWAACTKKTLRRAFARRA